MNVVYFASFLSLRFFSLSFCLCLCIGMRCVRVLSEYAESVHERQWRRRQRWTKELSKKLFTSFCTCSIIEKITWQDGSVDSVPKCTLSASVSPSITKL